jgi:hypothetical protein
VAEVSIGNMTVHTAFQIGNEKDRIGEIRSGVLTNRIPVLWIRVKPPAPPPFLKFFPGFASIAVLLMMFVVFLAVDLFAKHFFIRGGDAEVP